MGDMGGREKEEARTRDCTNGSLGDEDEEEQKENIQHFHSRTRQLPVLSFEFFLTLLSLSCSSFCSSSSRSLPSRSYLSLDRSLSNKLLP